MIAAPPVVQGDSDLQDALVESANRALFIHPQLFQGLVTGIILAPVELHDAAQQCLRRGVVTVGKESGAGLVHDGMARPPQSAAVVLAVAAGGGATRSRSTAIDSRV